MVRAKFKCTMVSKSEGMKKDDKGVYRPCPIFTIHMSPVYANGDPNHENSKFWEATPGGKLELNCINEDVAKRFELSKEYYIDFTPAE